MDLAAFKSSLQLAHPPTGISVYLRALWFAAKDDWETAHDLVQELPDRQAAHIHAYLHRVEGDIWNADYWYQRAGRTRPEISHEAEWDQIVRGLL
jgi:hypothetical protein